MLTLFQKSVLGVLAGGIVVLALVVSAKGSVASTPAGPLTLVTQGNQGGPPPGVVVVGEAKLNYTPDIAHVTLGAVEQATTAEAAQTQLAARLSKVLDRAKALGIADRDIANGGYSITPQYAYDRGTAPRITGYQATQQVVITLRDVKAVGKVLDALVRDDGATTASLQFALSAGKDPELDARQRAIADARDKAEAMAKAAGVRLGGAISISDAGGPSVYRGDFSVAAGKGPLPSTQVPTGDVELTVRMQVQFAILGG